MGKRRSRIGPFVPKKESHSIKMAGSQQFLEPCQKQRKRTYTNEQIHNKIRILGRITWQRTHYKQMSTTFMANKNNNNNKIGGDFLSKNFTFQSLYMHTQVTSGHAEQKE